MNGHWDVTETKEFLEGIRTPGRALKDYLVYRPIPKAILALRDKPDVHPKVTRAALLYKAHEGHERRYLYRAEYYNPMFCFWVIIIFEIPVYDDNGNPMEGFETGRPLYSTIDRYIFDLL
jgi:hypothetical protein